MTHYEESIFPWSFGEIKKRLKDMKLNSIEIHLAYNFPR